MKKIALTWIVGLLFIVMTTAGCTSKKTDNEKNSEGPGSMTMEGTEDTSDTGNANENIHIEVEYQDTYYKYERKPANLDMAEVITALLGDQVNIETQSVKVDGQMEDHGTVTINEITHTWYPTTDGMFYSNNSKKGNFDLDTARRIADTFVQNLGWENLKKTPEYIGNNSLVYTFEYENVNLMGNDSIYLTRGDDDVPPLTGAYISVEVTNNGIHSVYISPMPEIGAVIESYLPSEFMTPDMVLDLFLEGRQGETTITNCKMEIVYMPFLETSGAEVLIPVYCLQIEIDGYKGTFTKYIDALTGYEY